MRALSVELPFSVRETKDAAPQARGFAPTSSDSEASPPSRWASPAADLRTSRRSRLAARGRRADFCGTKARALSRGSSFLDLEKGGPSFRELPLQMEVLGVPRQLDKLWANPNETR